MHDQPIQQLSLDAIVRACQGEADQRRAAERGFCFELFRRAIEDRNQEAWASIAHQYHRLILRWVYDRAPVALDPDEAEDMAREALEKFWRALTTRAVRVTDQFGHIGALLKYLEQCALTTVLDHQRQARRKARLLDRLQTLQAAAPLTPSPSETAIDELCRAERLRQVRDWVRDTVADPLERRVLALSFEQDLTPAEIAERYPNEFPSVHVVRQIKERVLKRARRALESDSGATRSRS